jgi:hypothetical protein
MGYFFLQSHYVWSTYIITKGEALFLKKNNIADDSKIDNL